MWMSRRVASLLVIAFSFTFFIGCTSKNEERSSSSASFSQSLMDTKEISNDQQKEDFPLEAYDRTTSEWGTDVTGVRTTFQTEEQEIALTFDACGGPTGNALDQDLIDFLREESIQATLFINERWLLENEDAFIELANDPLFQIENHGTAHAPLSVQGGEAWGIVATASPEEVYDEIMNQHETVLTRTGKPMSLFRSGTAFYDEIAVQLAQDLGYEVVNFSVLGDAGATYSSDQVKEALLTATSGSIVLLHMNQPTSGTFEGVKQAIPLLQEHGYTFVQLEGKNLQ